MILPVIKSQWKYDKVESVDLLIRIACQIWIEERFRHIHNYAPWLFFGTMMTDISMIIALEQHYPMG
jgi:hypothetical protein